MPHRLVVIDGPATHAAWDIPFGETAVGRNSPAGLVTGGMVSRRLPVTPFDTAGSHLRRFTDGLRDAGALATVGTALATSLRALGALLGGPLI